MTNSNQNEKLFSDKGEIAFRKALGQRIRKLRIENGMSQTELGNRLGVSFQQIQKYEYGQNWINPYRLKCLMDIFDVPLR
jgi:transcriptional regulator with XRE-family HTH domain